MEAIIKLNITDCQESDWILDEYAAGKFRNLSDEDLSEVVESLIEAVIVENGVYYDADDVDRAVQVLLPVAMSILLNPRFFHVRANYDALLEMVTFLSVRLGRY